MTSGIVYCRDTEEVGDAVRIMESKQVRRLPVIDENRRMVGRVATVSVVDGLGHFSVFGTEALAVSRYG